MGFISCYHVLVPVCEMVPDFSCCRTKKSLSLLPVTMTPGAVLVVSEQSTICTFGQKKNTCTQWAPLTRDSLVWKQFRTPPLLQTSSSNSSTLSSPNNIALSNTITSLYFTQQTKPVFIFTIIRKQLEINYLKLPAVPRWENFSPAEQKSYDIYIVAVCTRVWWVLFSLTAINDISIGAGVGNQWLWYLYCPKKLLVCLTCLNCEMGGPWNSGPLMFLYCSILSIVGRWRGLWDTFHVPEIKSL